MPKLSIKSEGSGYKVVDAKGALYFHGTLAAAEQYIAWKGKKRSVREVTDMTVTLPKGTRSGRKVNNRIKTKSKGRIVTAKDILKGL